MSRQRTAELLRFMARLGDCAPLQSRAEIDAASAVVDYLGLPSHHDAQKNWDTLKTLYYVLENAAPGDPVLDAGAGRSSVILNWLHKLGFTRLYGCDIAAADADAYARRGIRFSVQDLAATDYESGFFRAISCISVIEHGVSLTAFASEMARILAPGGVLLVSTDYWSQPIDCSGIFPYGPAMGQMKVFDATQLGEFCEIARRSGLEACESVSFDTSERAVRWERVDREFTFAFVAFRKSR